MKAMTAKREYDAYLRVLQQVVKARGGDAAHAAAEYPWHGRATDVMSQPVGAVAMSSLLTGSLPADDFTI